MLLDHVAQNETVLSTLANLNISKEMFETMITVGNKIDLVLHLIILSHIFKAEKIHSSYSAFCHVTLAWKNVKVIKYKWKSFQMSLTRNWAFALVLTIDMFKDT